jgi:hypothetical protein
MKLKQSGKILLISFLFTLLSSCSVNNPIVGKWQNNPPDGVIFTFNSDNTVTIETPDKSKTANGKYSIVDNNATIMIKNPGELFSNYSSSNNSKIEFEYQIKENTLILSNIRTDLSFTTNLTIDMTLRINMQGNMEEEQRIECTKIGQNSIFGISIDSISIIIILAGLLLLGIIIIILFLIHRKKKIENSKFVAT